MTLVEFTYYPGWDSQQSGVRGKTASILVNPSQVVFVTSAQGFKGGDQCWIKLCWAGGEFLVEGNFATIAAALQGEPS